MANVQIYRLIDEQRAQRLKELSGTDNPTDLEQEIALARLLAEEAANLGQITLAKDLITTVGKLSQASEIAKYRRGDMLCKATVLQLASKIVELVATSVAGKFIGWEEELDRISQNIVGAVEDAKNDDVSDYAGVRERRAPQTRQIEVEIESQNEG